MNASEVEELRESDRVSHDNLRDGFSNEQQQLQRIQDAEAHRDRREGMSTEERQTRRATRENMTEEENNRRREAERFRRRSRKYQKGLAYYEAFDPSTIPGGRHYFSRYTDDTLEHERVCRHCGSWKFPDETEGCCCRKGLVTVRPPREAPAELNRLFGNPRFKQSIRAYNNVFAFTSMGSSRTRSLNVDERVTRSGVYNFRVQGSVCHRMGALLPPLNRRPMFAQVYINDPDMEARVASRMGMTDGLDPAILEKIDQVMTAHNGYTQQFLNAHRILIDRAGPAYQAAVEQFARQLVAGEARPGDNPALPAAEHRDIILNTRQGGFKRIYETSESYDPLQYPLMFPSGEPGWTYDLPYVGNPVDSNGKPLTMSLREYESYYCVDQWAKYEQERLRFIEKNQLQYRLETLQGLTDALRNESVDVHRVAANEEVAQRGSTAARRQSWDTGVDSTEPEAENIDRKVIIPPTFTRGPRYMYQLREAGAPNLFITMTCNPNWPEIKENLKPGEKASDRLDIVA
ncbi:Helitron helicase-like protein, partial [Phytophthora palmivora]